MVHFVYESLYPRETLYMPPMHMGTFMFRDIFLPLRIPVFYGHVSINLLISLEGVPENTIKWIHQSDEAAGTFHDQWIDLFDFVYGLDEISKTHTVPDHAIEFWQLAKQQLEGAAATLLGSIDKYTVIQNSVISMELTLKAALLAKRETEKNVRKFGHDLCKLVSAVCKQLPYADHDRLELVAHRAPPLVERRYEAKDYKRTEIGRILMDAQFVAGEILRQFSSSDVRSGLKSETPKTGPGVSRYYPVLT